MRNYTLFEIYFSVICECFFNQGRAGRVAANVMFYLLLLLTVIGQAVGTAT